MKNQKGMTLFIAVVIMSILLFISFAVVNITLKGILFASSGRDSQYAFYAADAGLECAQYWDSKFNSFATSTSGSPINCGSMSIYNGQAIPGGATVMIGGGLYANATSTLYFDMNQGSNPMPYCVIVTVAKNTNGTTYIKSKGYNTCDTSNLRRVERGVEMTY